ncbi:MAG: insulinase family protein [Deltaproteobacteria bacterium]|nr:insulinase family protein [Deltaproteobacteria bacterium]
MKKYFGLVFIVLLLFVNSACVRNTFIKENLKTFQEFRLSNGIPVVVKVTGQSRIRSLVLTLAGGKALVPPEKAGLDKVAFRLMAMESKQFSDVERRALLKRTSASIGAGDGLDYATYSLKTIDAYFDETFRLYADLLMNPVFPEAFFKEIMTNMANAYRGKLTDGYARVSLALNSDFFSGHPYYAHLENPATLENISLSDVKQYYREHIVASGMQLFAVGDYDIDTLRHKLESTFGTLPAGKPVGRTTPFLTLPQESPLIIDPCESLNPDVSYVRGNFSTIAVTHADYWAVRLAIAIVSDLLSDIVRTKNSLVYSVWAHIYGKKANYGALSAYRTSDPVKLIELMRQAVDIAASGRCVSPWNDQGSADQYVPIAQALEFYKASFATGFYSGLQTNGSIAAQMANSRIMTGDYTAYLRVMENIGRVTAEDVARVVRTCIKEASVQWAVSAHPETVETLKKHSGAYAPTYKIVNLDGGRQ